ncbi:MAG: PolC-type DNA polymerase III, partial [Candidatus Woesearchaeota archaeon]
MAKINYNHIEKVKNILKYHNKYVVFDIETTGFSAKKGDMITEIGAVKIKNNKITERFQTFINPNRPIPKKITELTGITDDMVKDAPMLEIALTDFISFIKDSPLVAHNGLKFDIPFITYFLDEMGIELINPVIDTLHLSRDKLSDLSSHKLIKVCEKLDISLDGAHRADNDAEATAKVFIKLKDMYLSNSNMDNQITIDYVSTQKNDVPKYLGDNQEFVLVKKNNKTIKKKDTNIKDNKVKSNINIEVEEINYWANYGLKRLYLKTNLGEGYYDCNKQKFSGLNNAYRDEIIK